MDIPFLLTKYFNGREWSLKGNSYMELVFTDGLPPVTLEELEEKNTLRQSELAQTEYQRLREEDYRKEDINSEKMIFALWDYVVEGKEAAIEDIQTKRQAIKNKHPKPE